MTGNADGVEQSETPGEGDTRRPVTAAIMDAFASKAFALECPEITLTQNTPNEPEIIRGRGSISLLDRPDFELKVYADPGTDPIRELMRANDWVSGTLVPESDFYRVTAKDLHGNTWISEPVLITRSGVERVLIQTTLLRLKHVSKCPPDRNSLSLLFFDDPEVVYNQYVERRTTVAGDTGRSRELGAAAFETADFDIRARPTLTKDHPLTLRILFKTQTPPAGVEHRVIEALQYATFSPVSWSISQRECAGVREVVLAPRIATRPSLMSPPVPADPIHGAEDFWALFAAYLKHVIPYSDSEHFSPLSSQLRPLIHAENLELVGLALLLSVAVEGVLNLEYPSLAEPPDAFKASVDEAIKALKGIQGLHPDILRRAPGALEQMKRARAQDKLRALRAEGLITEEMLGAWRRIRNASAHASIDRKSHDAQNLWDDCNAVTTMLNLLVFRAIGYSGEYVDFAAQGWPRRSFPPAAPTAPPGASPREAGTGA